MRLATVLTPLSDENLTLAAQCGVEDVVIRYPGPELSRLLETKARIESFGLRLGVIEGYLPIENAILGNDRREADFDALRTLLRNMGEAGVPVASYHFMAGTDWVRTSTTARERGGALVTAFDAERAAEAAVSLDSGKRLEVEPISADALWDNLERLLNEILPTAEDAGVTLAMHPDDPPLPEFLGRARIMNCVEGFERLVALAPSPRNRICFCQGTFAEMGVDVPATIRRLGPHIGYVHFRDVRGTREQFVETFHDNGRTDMPAAMRAYRDVGYDGPLRPDHVPQLFGEDEGEPGYTMLGRLYAFGYVRGLMQAVAGEEHSSS